MAAFNDANMPGARNALETIEKLKLKGLTQGMAESMINTVDLTTRRYWIVDNSGSMDTNDGKRVVNGEAISCTRWQELGDSLKWHAEVSEILGAYTEFRMLNKTGWSRLKSQQVVVGPVGSAQEIDQVLSSRPDHRTPLCATLRTLVADIQALAPELEDAGKSVSVIIASDGEATDGDMNDVKAALAPLADLPCDVVVRLCTDEDHVVDYWNAIDGDLELELDVLDDTAGEGKEVRGFNPWIGYGEALQRVREFGAAPKVFDLLDERSLAVPEAVVMIKHILGEEISGTFPNPQLNSNGYRDALRVAIKNIPQVFDASQEAVVPWVNTESFSKTVLGL